MPISCGAGCSICFAVWPALPADHANYHPGLSAQLFSGSACWHGKYSFVIWMLCDRVDFLPCHSNILKCFTIFLGVLVTARETLCCTKQVSVRWEAIEVNRMALSLFPPPPPPPEAFARAGMVLCPMYMYWEKWGRDKTGHQAQLTESQATGLLLLE